MKNNKAITRKGTIRKQQWWGLDYFYTKHLQSSRIVGKTTLRGTQEGKKT